MYFLATWIDLHSHRVAEAAPGREHRRPTAEAQWTVPGHSEVQGAVEIERIPIVIEIQSATLLWIDLHVDVKPVERRADREVFEEPVFQSEIHFIHRALKLVKFNVEPVKARLAHEPRGEFIVDQQSKRW